MNPDIKGIISDMDGVILDTEKLYVRFWCEAALFYGYPMETHHALSIRSMARPFAIAKLKGFFGEDFDYCKVHDKRIELMDKFISENGIESKPGAAEFLGFLKQNGLPLQPQPLRRERKNIFRLSVFTIILTK